MYRVELKEGLGGVKVIFLPYNMFLMYRVELKGKQKRYACFTGNNPKFLMYRVELKVSQERWEWRNDPPPVPNVPCGVERFPTSPLLL